MTAFLDRISAIVAPANLALGDDCARWAMDWTHNYPSTPLAVARPATTAQVSAIMAAAHAAGVPVVPVAGFTGLVGGAQANGALLLSVDRLSAIREIRTGERIAIVEAGVVLDALHAAADAKNLIFPMTFGARGQCMIGGMLGTNAGGSNVLRYGNTRDLCLGIEVVLADGRVMDLMSELHKDNAGLNLRNLIVGSEGTLGIITAAVLKLKPKPAAYATAMLAVPALSDALSLLNRLQDESGGAVEAFEYMSRSYVAAHVADLGGREPFAEPHDVNIMVELGATAPRDARAGPDGTVPIVALLENALAPMLDDGTLRDAVVAQNEAQRREIWARRDDAGELIFMRHPHVNVDICLPTASVAPFLTRALAAMTALDPGCTDTAVAHLGDGNIHYTVYPGRDDAALFDAMVEAVEDLVSEMRGSFSAEHGVGQSKLNSMRRRKDPVALDVMRNIKAALDPKNILNPGKVYPQPSDS